MFDILLSTSAYALIIVVGAVCSHTGFIKSETKNVFSGNVKFFAHFES